MCGLVLRLGGLNAPVTYDEAYTYVAFASRSWWGALSDYSVPNNHIFHTLLVQLAVHIFGNHPWSLRLPALLAGLALIPAAYVLGKKLYSTETGLVAAALVAYLPELVFFSTDARGYSLVAFFTLLSFIFGLQVTRKKSHLAWQALVLCTALGCFTVPTMLLPSGGLFLWLLLEGLLNKTIERKPYFVSFFLSGSASVLLTAGLYLPALVVSGWHKLLANGFVQPVQAKEYFGWILAQHLSDTWTTWTQALPLALTALLILGFLLALVLYKQITSTRVPLQLALLGWITFWVLLRRPDAYDRFWSFLLAPALLWAAAGLVETLRRIKGSPAWVPAALTSLAVAGLVAVALISIPTIPTQWAKLSNAEASALYLKNNLRPGDLALVGYPNNAPVWYYLEVHGEPESYWRTDSGHPKRAFLLLAANQKTQTLESIVKSYGLGTGMFLLDKAQYLGRYGQIYLYVCNVK